MEERPVRLGVRQSIVFVTGVSVCAICHCHGCAVVWDESEEDRGYMSWKHDKDDDRPLSAAPVDLVAIDLDGTLLRSDGSICFSAAQAILEAVEKGVKIVLCSGRAPRSMMKIYDALGLKTVLIAHNGALVFDPILNTTLEHETMPGALARQVIEVARSVEPTVAAAVEVNGHCYTDTVRKKPKAAATMATSYALGGGVVDHVAPPPAADMQHPAGSLFDVLDLPVTKVMFVGTSDVLGGIQMSLQAKLADKVGFSFSDLRLLQVVRGGVDKATALEKVAARYGVPRQGVMAIGDAPNDMGMLGWAGLGVAMQNAWEEVRRAAHFVCPTNDDAGVAQALRKYALTR